MKLVQCPTCQKSIKWSPKFPYRPFCCERCRVIDLGSWADNSYAIPSVPSSGESLDLENKEFEK